MGITLVVRLHNWKITIFNGKTWENSLFRLGHGFNSYVRNYQMVRYQAISIGLISLSLNPVPRSESIRCRGSTYDTWLQLSKWKKPKMKPGYIPCIHRVIFRFVGQKTSRNNDAIFFWDEDDEHPSYFDVTLW